MTRGSASSSRPTKTAPQTAPDDRPFDPSLLKQAAATAARYRITLEPDDDAYTARAVEFPTIFTSAPTPNDCDAKIRQMLTIAVATMLEMGQRPPLPAAKRRVQVNIRLSADEKTRLEEAAHHAGFRGLSEYIRFAALHMSRNA